MKSITVRDLQRSVRACMNAAQRDRVVVTRHGRPAVLLVGIEGYDWEDLVLSTSPKFWKFIEGRRQGRLVPLDEVERRLGLKATKPGKRNRARRSG